MAWTVELAKSAEKDLDRLDRRQAERILVFLRDRVAKADDPRASGKQLRGVQREFWRFRVGDYRVLCRLEDHRLVVLLVRIGHRRDVYDT